MEEIIVESTVPQTVTDKATEKQGTPEPQLDAVSGGQTDDTSKSKKKKKKKKKIRQIIVESEGNDLQRDKLKSGVDEGTNLEKGSKEILGTLETDVVQEAVVFETIAASFMEERSTVESTVSEDLVEKEVVKQHDEVLNHQHGTTVPSEDGTSLNLERTSSLDALKATGTKAVGSLFSRFKVGLKKPLPSQMESPVNATAKKNEVIVAKNQDNSSVCKNKELTRQNHHIMNMGVEKEATQILTAAQQQGMSNPISGATTEAPLEAAKEQVKAFESVREDNTIVQEVNAGMIDDVIQEAGCVISADVVNHDIVAATHSTLSTSVTSIKHTTNKVDHDEKLQEISNLTDHFSEADVIISEPASDTTVTSSVYAGSSAASTENEAVTTTDSAQNKVISLTGSVEDDGILAIENATDKSSQDSTTKAHNEAVSSIECSQSKTLQTIERTQNKAFSPTENLENETVKLQGEAVSMTDSAQNETILSIERTQNGAVSPNASAHDEGAFSTERAQNEINLMTERTQKGAILSTESNQAGSATMTESAEGGNVWSTESAHKEPCLSAEMTQTEIGDLTESNRDGTFPAAEIAQNAVFLSTQSTRNEAVLSIESSRADVVPSTASDQEEAFSLAKSAQNENLLAIESARSEAQSSTHSAHDENISMKSSDLLSITVTSPTKDLSAKTASPVKLEKLSPVKSIACRFEGKQEQSLDSLKFRTVREFFPAERSIRVGAEKEKFEAQTQQQQLKAKAEEVAKAKYNTSIKSFDEISESESVTGTVPSTSAFQTPDAASTRKACSFDEVSISSQSSSKFSDEALTPVKSIASRFEGKREQSLDSLKFRTVREFFPTEEERSVRVGAEKAKYEALTIQQKKASKIGQLKVKHESLVNEQRSSVKSLASADTMPKKSLSTLDESLATKASSVSSDSEVRRREKVKVMSKTITTEVEADKSATKDIEAVVPTKEEIGGGLTAQSNNAAAGSSIRREDNDVRYHNEVNCGDSSKEDDSMCIGENEESRRELNQQCSFADGGISNNPVSNEQISTGVEVGEKPMISTPKAGILNDQVVLEHSVNFFTTKTEIAANPSEAINHTDNGQVNKVREDIPTETELTASCADGEIAETDQNEPVAEPPTFLQGDVSSIPLMLTTERSFVMDKDDMIETEDTVVVRERPMTDGEDESELVSSATLLPTHKSHAGITSSQSKKQERVKEAAVVFKSKKRVPGPAPVVSTMVTKAEAPLKRKSTTPKVEPTASNARQNQLLSKQLDTKSATGYVRRSPGASVAAATVSLQVRNIGKVSTAESAHSVLTAPIAPKCASIMAPSVSSKAKKAAEATKEVFAPSPARSKRYASIKSKVLDGINNIVSHKKITKEDFIAAERRKSLGSANARSGFDTDDRRASLTARASISGPPEQFIRSAFSRKKLNATAPRYMNYENARGYAERARVQYERRKRLEAANAVKSEKRQRELHMFFAELHHKSSKANADEVRRGLEAHEFIQLAKENERQALEMLRKDKQRSAQGKHHTSPAASNAGSSFRSKKSSISSSASVEGKVMVVEVMNAVKQDNIKKKAEVETETISFSFEDGNSVLEKVLQSDKEEVAIRE
ncbi:hypothetical protein Plhal304r1_c008g0034251 [Plasmopara halstedii]